MGVATNSRHELTKFIDRLPIWFDQDKCLDVLTKSFNAFISTDDFCMADVDDRIDTVYFMQSLKGMVSDIELIRKEASRG